MFGSAQLFSASAAAPPAPTVVGNDGRAQKKEEKMITLPTTIRGVQVAAAALRGEERPKFFGSIEAEVVVVVAVVEELVRQTASAELSLNDGTGRIKARYYASGEGDSSLDHLRVGSYVSVAAGVRLLPELHLGVIGIFPVKSADEVSYHIISCAHAAVRAKHGGASAVAASAAKEAFVAAATPPPRKREAAALESEDPTPTKASLAAEKLAEPTFSAPAPTAVAAKVGPAGGATSVEAAVTKILDGPGRENSEGLSIAEIVAMLGAEGMAFSSKDVQTFINARIEEGEVFTTIDDDHFAAI